MEIKDSKLLDEAYAFVKKNLSEAETSPGNERRHYRGEIEPIDFIEDQRLGHHEANVVKYICRWKNKGKVLDLFKAIWFLMRRIELAIRDGEHSERSETAGDKNWDS